MTPQPRHPPSTSGSKVLVALFFFGATFLGLSGNSLIRSRFTAVTASATSSILLLMLGDSFTFARIASVLVRPRRRHGHPRGRNCPSRPPRSSFLVGHRRDASRSRGHVLHAVASRQNFHRAIRRYAVGSPSRPSLRASPPREDAAQDHVIPPVPVRQWVIFVPKRLRGFLADRSAAVAALARIFLDEIERFLLTASGVNPAADTPRVSRRRLGGISFLHRFGSALNHRHRYHGVFAPNHKLRKAVTALAIGNVGKRQEAATGGHMDDGRATGGCRDATHANQKPRSHDTSRIAWAKLLARVGEEFPLECRKLRRLRPADRVQAALRVRNHPWPSHSWQPPLAADILPANQGRSARSCPILAYRSSHHQSRRSVDRPPTGASSCRSMTTAERFRRRPTSCP